MLFMRLGGWPRTVGLEPSTLNVRIWRTDTVLLIFKSFTLTFKLKLQLELVTLLLVSSSSILIWGASRYFVAKPNGINVIVRFS